MSALSVLLAALAVGCKDGQDQAGSKLTDREYLLDSSRGFQPVADTTVRLSFNGAELSFNAGCNIHSGPFSVRGGRLVVDDLGSTEIGCEPSRHAQDEWLAAFITSRPELEQAGERLTLTGMDATLVFLDREVADPDRPLVETLWTIDTFISNGAASNVPLDKAPTLTFRATGEIEVFTGCNQGTGQYEVNGNELTFSAVIYTEIGCPQQSAFAEAHVQAVIQQGKATFEIDGPSLTIEGSNGRGLGAQAP